MFFQILSNRPQAAPAAHYIHIKWHAAKCPGDTSRNSGRSSAQRAVAWGHQEANLQPGGVLMGLGISPFNICTFLFLLMAGSSSGTADIRAWV